MSLVLSFNESPFTSTVSESLLRNKMILSSNEEATIKDNNSNVYNGPLNEPKMNFRMFIDFIINKLKFFYYKF